MAKTRLHCPHCGRVGSTSREIRSGMSVRCPGCRELFKAEITAPEPIKPPTTSLDPSLVTSPTTIESNTSPTTAVQSSRTPLLIGAGVLILSVGVGVTWLSFRPIEPVAGVAQGPTSLPIAPLVAVPTPSGQPITPASDEDEDDAIADFLADHPPASVDEVPSKDDPAYGGVILLALMTKAGGKSIQGHGMKAWLEGCTHEQRLAIELQRLGRHPEDIFRRGWDAEVPNLLKTLRDDIGTPAAKIKANDLQRLARLVRPADEDGEREGAVYEDSEASDAIVERCLSRGEKIEDALSNDIHAYFHRIWLQSDRGKLWADW